MLVATNPFSGKNINEYSALDKAGIDQHIAAAVDAFPAWQAKSISARADVLRAVAAKLRENNDTLAKLMADEMGKPIKEGGPEVEKAVWCAKHYAEHVQAYLSDEVLDSDASKSYVHYQPLGTLLGSLPWNAPLWLASRYLAPALMAGNTCLMKHDPNVPGCAQAIAEVFEQAGAPGGIMVNLPFVTSQVESVIHDKRIAAVSFTCSSAAGRKVAALAGSEIKPTVLELAGSDPFIVMADADLEKAADVATLSRIINAGQSCIAAKRIIVEKSVYTSFTDMLKTRLEKLKLGDPNASDTDVGPLAQKDLRDNLHRQVQQSIAAGARCLLGGELPSGEDFFYPATLLVDVDNSMCAFTEETFSPMMAVMPADNQEQAIDIANNTDYGLGAGLWMADQQKPEKIAMRINAGQVAINGIVKTDPRLPSGGIKGSGYGRELGPHGIKEFVNAKQIWIK